jgi:Ankyrin repeats (3 copies)
MNKKALFLCFSLMNAFIILPQNYKAFIKHIMAEEQNKAQTEFENYVTLINEQLQEHSPLTNEQQQKLNSLFNERKILVNQIRQSFLHEAFSQLLHQHNTPSIFSSLTNLREALRNISHNTTQPMLEQDLAEIDREIEQIVHQQHTTSSFNRTQTYPTTKQLTTAGTLIAVVTGLAIIGLQKFKNLFSSRQGTNTSQPQPPPSTIPLTAPPITLETPPSPLTFGSGSSPTIIPQHTYYNTECINSSSWKTLFDTFGKKWSEEVMSINKQIRMLKNQQVSSQEQVSKIEDLTIQRDQAKHRLIIELSFNINNLLNKGVDINAHIEPDTTLLMYAIEKTRGHAMIIHLLLHCGADQSINTNNDEKITALVMAVYAKSPKLVQLLLSYGATVDTIGDPDHKKAAEQYISRNQLESFYHTLELQSNSSFEEIEDAYKKLTSFYNSKTRTEHPVDTIIYKVFAQQHTKKLKKICEAYSQFYCLHNFVSGLSRVSFDYN